MLRTKPQDKWLLRAEQNPQTDAEFEHIIGLGQSFVRRIEQALNEHRHIPSIAEMSNFKGHLYTSFFSSFGGGVTQFFSRQEETVTHQPNDQEIVVYGQFALQHPKIQGRPLFFDGEWRSVIIAAIDWDPIWLQSIALHELFHAKQHRAGVASAKAPVLSDVWVSEEILAHSLEHEVLEKGTKGKYGEVIRSIVASQTTGNKKDLISRVTLADLNRLDALFRPAGERETGIRCAQYWVSILDEWTKVHISDPNMRLQEQIANYKLLVTSQTK